VEEHGGHWIDSERLSGILAMKIVRECSDDSRISNILAKRGHIFGLMGVIELKTMFSGTAA
jgi:hypothetical protein